MEKERGLIGVYVVVVVYIGVLVVVRVRVGLHGSPTQRLLVVAYKVTVGLRAGGYLEAMACTTRYG